MRLVAPILAYHSIHPSRFDAINVTPDHFYAQIKWLSQRGYRGVSLGEYLRYVAEQPAKAGNLVTLTFDDGYLDNLTYAWPILEKFGFSATIFVIAERVGTDQTIDPDLLSTHPDVPRAAYHFLSWSNIQALNRQGIEIGSHTCTHPKLDQLDIATQHYEIEASKKIIETQIQQPVASFCYPYGHFNDDSLYIVKAAGYQQAVVTPWRAGLIRGGSFTLRRVGLYRRDTLLRFVYKISPLFELARTIKHTRAQAVRAQEMGQ